MMDIIRTSTIRRPALPNNAEISPSLLGASTTSVDWILSLHPRLAFFLREPRQKRKKCHVPLIVVPLELARRAKKRTVVPENVVNATTITPATIAVWKFNIVPIRSMPKGRRKRV
eukprot:scaffold3763_cov165-Amphora_coffeaeformis.AAC.16